MVKGQLNLENTSYTGTAKLTWLPTTPTTPTTVVHFDHLISKAILKPNDDFKDYVNRNTRVCHVILMVSCDPSIYRRNLLCWVMLASKS